MEVFSLTPAIDKILRIADLTHQQIISDLANYRELNDLIEDVSEFMLIEERVDVIVFCVIFKLILTCEENQVLKVTDHFKWETENGEKVISSSADLVIMGVVYRFKNRFKRAKRNYELNPLYAKHIFNERIGRVEMKDIDRLSTMAKIMRVNELTYGKPLPRLIDGDRELEELVVDLRWFFSMQFVDMAIVFCAIIKYAHTNHYDQISEVLKHFGGSDDKRVNHYLNHLVLHGYVSWAKGEEREELNPFVLDKTLLQHIINNSPLSTDDLQMIIERGNIYSVFDDDGVYYPDNFFVMDVEERFNEYWKICNKAKQVIVPVDEISPEDLQFIEKFYTRNVTNTTHFTTHFDRLLEAGYVNEEIDAFLKQNKAEIGKCITLNEYGHVLVYDKNEKVSYVMIPTTEA